MIRALCISTVVRFVFAFLIMGFLKANAASMQCDSLLCAATERHTNGHDQLTLMEIRGLADQGNFDSALEGIEQFLEETPAHVEGRLLLGVFLIWRGELDRATDVFRKLADDHPGLAEPHNNLAAIYVSNGQYREAESSLRKAVSVDPDYKVAWENLGDIRIKLASILYERANELYAADERSGVGSDTGIKAKIGKKSIAMKEILDKIDYFFRADETVDVVSQSQMNVGAIVVAKSSDGVNIVSKEEFSDPVCYSVGPLLDQANFMLITDWLKENNIFTSTYTRDIQKSHRYEVFLPPLGSYLEAEALVRKMRGDGIHNIALIPQGSLKHGVMIGAFGTEGAAKRRIDELWEKGYDAKYQPKIQPDRWYWIKAYPTVDSPLDKLAFTKRFPAYVPKVIPCE
uniref:TPR repeat-containing protein n=1 Tax=Candidatus Kentrum sp. TUN TaxID=2126343 RepID=A0A450ZFI0_9GAMM|nr:MAG: TPR repeat-containing protein [Candidatus Kentron sp. TUN]VFK52828.1 MAG: TPR repeat-containing protein [Candidatus Kentron sp. TUN]